MAAEAQRLLISEEEYEEGEEELARMDAGLYTLQQVLSACIRKCDSTAGSRPHRDRGVLPRSCGERTGGVTHLVQKIACKCEPHPYTTAADCALVSVPQCALIIANLWMVGDAGIRKRVLTLLHQRSQTLAAIRAVLKEHHDSLGDEGEPAQASTYSQPYLPSLDEKGHEDEAL